MELLTHLYVVFTGLGALAGLTVVGMATRAYHRTARPAVFGIGLGFLLIVAAMIATTTSALLLDFRGIRRILVVHNISASVGIGILLYSLSSEGNSGG